jgi:uncharacterized FAD-dependent dehydrogenase
MMSESNSSFSARPYDAVVVGAGPAGLSAAAVLADRGMRTLVIEKGLPFEDRVCSCNRPGFCQRPYCDALSGVGGTSAIYGSKLCGYPSGGGLRNLASEGDIWSAHCDLISLIGHEEREIVSALVGVSPRSLSFEHIPGGVWKPYAASILYRQEMKLFIGALLRAVNERQGRVMSQTEVDGIEVHREGFKVICKSASHGSAEIVARVLVLASGRSGARWMENVMASVGIASELGYLDFGVRIEAPYRIIQTFAERYGQDAKMKFDTSPYPCRTFCLCSGGILAPIAYGGIRYVEGVFGDRSCNRGNLALMCRIPVAAGVSCSQQAMRLMEEFQQNGEFVAQSLISLMTGSSPEVQIQPSITAKVSSIRARLSPDVLSSLLDGLSRFLFIAPEFLIEDTNVIGPALDHYWNVFKTEEGFKTPIDNLFLVGDALGQFRGILQAAWSGIICAKNVAVGSRSSDRLSFMANIPESANMEKILINV